MKPMLLLCYCLVVLSVFAQNKITEQELKRYEWIICNKNVADSSEIFGSDTLVLAKSYDLESLEEINGETGQKMAALYPRDWRIDFSPDESGGKDQLNEFFVFFIDLRQAAKRQSMEVDSATYQLILQALTPGTLEMTPSISELGQMQSGDIIQIIDSFHHQSYYIEKTGNQFQVLKTLKKRYFLEPKGIREGFWTLSKRKQLINLSTGMSEINFLFRIERLDQLRIRLIPV